MNNRKSEKKSASEKAASFFAAHRPVKLPEPAEAAQKDIATKKHDRGYDYLFKILVVGGPGVGKTNLILRFSDDNFVDGYLDSFGAHYKFRTVELNNQKIKFQIWDTKDLLKSSLSDTNGKGDLILLLYDTNSLESFKHLPEYLARCLWFVDAFNQIILIGCKNDSVDDRQVSYAAGKRFADNHNIQFMECSARENKNVKEIFEGAAWLCLAEKERTEAREKTRPENKGWRIGLVEFKPLTLPPAPDSSEHRTLNMIVNTINNESTHFNNDFNNESKNFGDDEKSLYEQFQTTLDSKSSPTQKLVAIKSSLEKYFAGNNLIAETAQENNARLKAATIRHMDSRIKLLATIYLGIYNISDNATREKKLEIFRHLEIMLLAQYEFEQAAAVARENKHALKDEAKIARAENAKANDVAAPVSKKAEALSPAPEQSGNNSPDAAGAATTRQSRNIR